MTKRRVPKRAAPPQKRRSAEMSQAEFGRHIDVSQQRVQQMIASGTITAMANGKIDPEVGRLEYIRNIRRSPGSEEVRRVAAARATRIEIQNEREIGRLVLIEDVEIVHTQIISTLCAEFAAVGTSATRDLELRDVIDNLVGGAIDRTKGRLSAFASNVRSGLPVLKDDDDDEEGDD